MLEENQISASPLLLVICCWSTAAVNHNAPAPLPEHVGRPRKAPLLHPSDHGHGQRQEEVHHTCMAGQKYCSRDLLVNWWFSKGFLYIYHMCISNLTCCWPTGCLHVYVHLPLVEFCHLKLLQHAAMLCKWLENPSASPQMLHRSVGDVKIVGQKSALRIVSCNSSASSSTF